MDPKKTVAVQDWPVLKNVYELQQFLGLGNWLRYFIKDYSSVIKPLTMLMAIPNNEDPFYVEADASDFVTSGLLLQKQDGKWKVIAYRLSTFLKMERNYEIYDKKMLIIIQALKKW
ncbi:hypothetical protein ACEPAF_2576 [Sanghuangporus sanghuang]